MFDDFDLQVQCEEYYNEDYYGEELQYEEEEFWEGANPSRQIKKITVDIIKKIWYNKDS